MRHVVHGISLLALLAAGTPALAQQTKKSDKRAATAPAGNTTDPADDPTLDTPDVVVNGVQPGQVHTDIKPEEVLTPADIRSYGASTVTELLDALAPQTSSARGRGGGRPVVLLNGMRIANFHEIHKLPTEAILRVDILPEEAALAYGYRADQRVVNIVLRPRFRAYTAELDNKVPSAGGTNDLEAEAGLLKINKKSRLNLDFEYEHMSPLFESERNLTSARSSKYDVTGNVLPVPGATQVDPALSAAAGTNVTIAGVPASASAGGATLADFVPTANIANVTDTTPYRTLRSASDRVQATSVYNRMLGTVSATGTLNFELTQSRGYQGLAGVLLDLPSTNPFSPFSTDTVVARYAAGVPLVRDSQAWTGDASIGLNGALGTGWRWSLNTNYSRAQTITNTDRSINGTALQTALNTGNPSFNPFGPLDAFGRLSLLSDYARSISSDASVDGLVSGAPFSLPAGDAQLSVRMKLDTLDYSTLAVRSGLTQTGNIGRDSATVRTSLSLPIANAGRDVLPALGNLSISGDAEYNRLSDFGSLWTLGSTLNWSPAKPVTLIISYTHEQGAPSPQQLGDPTILTPNVTIFDYVKGQSVEVTQITGGNPLLTRDKRNVMKVGLSLKPLTDTDLRLSADYVRSILTDSAATFPTPTAEIEAAFPGRFVRDANGNLISIDSRPINLANVRSQQIRFGINFSKPIKSALQKKIERMRAAGQDPRELFRGRRQRRQDGDAAKGDAAKGSDGKQASSDGARSRGPRGGGGRFGRFGGGRGGGRLRLSLYYTLQLENSILIRDGVPRLDLLNGSATGSNGGAPRHNLELNGGLYKDGFGFRLKADYKSATYVNGGVSGANRLDFGDIATVDLRVFANLSGQRALVRKHPWMRGMRVEFGIENLFDAHQRVTDANGIVPVSYQPGYIDPLGRVFRIRIRKMFF